MPTHVILMTEFRQTEQSHRPYHCEYALLSSISIWLYILVVAVESLSYRWLSCISPNYRFSAAKGTGSNTSEPTLRSNLLS